MKRNSVAKPLVLIETAMFFFLYQVLIGPPGAWGNEELAIPETW